MRKLTLIAFTFFLLFIFITNIEEETKESIIFFKLDPFVSVEEAVTQLSLGKIKNREGYEVNWEVSSTTTDSIYLRQDISLLFEEGILKGVLSDWEDNSQTLTQVATMPGEDSSRYMSISFHHGEIHTEDEITSTQAMSKDLLYVVDSSSKPIYSFKEAVTSEQKEWKDVLDTVSEQQLTQAWSRTINSFEIPSRNYFSYSLAELVDIEKFPNFNKDKTQEIIGKLWEGIYKEYFLGIKTYDGSIIPPIGSTMPLILLAKDSSHLLVLFETANGEAIRLIQQIN